MGAVELFFFYLLAAAAPLSLAALNAGAVGLTLFFIARAVRGRVRFGPPQWSFVAFVGWDAVSALLSQTPGDSLVGVLDLWSWLPFLVAGAMPSAIRERSARFAGFLAFSACLTVPMDLAQFFLGTDFNHGQRLFKHVPIGTVNACGFFSHHLTYAGIISLVLALAAGRALYGTAGRTKWFLASFLSGLALLLTLARSYLLAAVPAAVALLLPKGRRWVFWTFMGALLVALTLWTAGPPKVRERAESLLDLRHPSNAERVYLWISGWQMVRQHPIAGWGPGESYERFSPPFKAPFARNIVYPDRVGFRTTSHCHNLYLMILIRSGFVGLAIFVLFLALAIRDLLRQKEPALRWGVLAGTVAILIGGLFEFNLGDAEVATLAFFLLGLGCAGTLAETSEPRAGRTG